MNWYCGWWHAAYRKTPCGSVLTDHDTPFTVIPNTRTMCAMDPFVFEHGGQTYVFAEVYSLFRQRGAIGYCRMDGDRFTKWKTVIVEPYHLSYPYLIERGGEVYMIPESYQSGEVYVYRAVEFPETWEKIHVMKDGVKYVDTSFLCEGDDTYAFTYDIEADPHRLLLYRLQNGIMSEEACKEISRDDAVARPGGYPFRKDGKWIRVSQDCDGSYGKAVVFSEIAESFWESYSETPVDRFGIDDVKLTKPLRYAIEGLHTYTATPSMEVIDLKGRRVSLVDIVVRIGLKIKNKLTR